MLFVSLCFYWQRLFVFFVEEKKRTRTNETTFAFFPLWQGSGAEAPATIWEDDAGQNRETGGREGRFFGLRAHARLSFNSF